MTDNKNKEDNYKKTIVSEQSSTIFPESTHYIKHADGLKKSIKFWLWIIVSLPILIIVYNVCFPFLFKYYVNSLQGLIKNEDFLILYFTSKYSITIFLSIVFIFALSIYKVKSNLRNIYYDKASAIEYLGNYHEKKSKVRQRIFTEVLCNSHTILEKKKKNSLHLPLLKELIYLLKK